MTVMECAFDPAFGEAWNRGQCLGILSLPDVWLSLATQADTPIGFALSRLLVDDAELLLLAVAPDARGQGAGAALIERTAGIAATRGAERLLLEVRDGNAALGLYTRTGFGPIGRRQGYYRGVDGRSHDALTLARPLG
ncbi:GNAT family N-acetyltransferase [Sphingomonas nostoxanthinifaciens]|nr:GNAT family N-acetyltransferase [Sphingomonas nostoxanthinifaciens]